MARYIDADELYKAAQKRIAEANEARMAVVDDEFLDLINDAFTEDVAPRAEVAREIFNDIAKMFLEKQKQYEYSHQSGKARQMMVARFEVYKLKKKYTEPEPPEGD